MYPETFPCRKHQPSGHLRDEYMTPSKSRYANSTGTRDNLCCFNMPIVFVKSSEKDLNLIENLEFGTKLKEAAASHWCMKTCSVEFNNMIISKI